MVTFLAGDLQEWLFLAGDAGNSLPVPGPVTEGSLQLRCGSVWKGHRGTRRGVLGELPLLAALLHVSEVSFC